MAIRVLPIHLVNKIAAGEVIERPASVVKELLENAVDAGATRIDVTIEDGGRRLISVADDGGGMSAEDLSLAFVPHATSKISAEDDLYAINTMGFRGEALASVASISHAHIRTRRRDDESGMEISSAGETVGETKPCAAPPGTCVTVRDLFFNTPARRKFMRTTATELGHVSDQLARIALPNPPIAFTLTHNGKTIQNLPRAESTRARATDLFGAEVCEGLLTVTSGDDRIRVTGLISPPDRLRASGRWQYCFLNGRFIRDRLLNHALKEAYRGLADASRWPVAFLFIEMDPSEVDVNVHPTKIEVRFRDSQAVHGHVLAAMRTALNKAQRPALAQLDNARNDDDNLPMDQRRQSIRQAMADFFKSQPPPQAKLDLTPRTYESPSRQQDRDFRRPVPPAPTPAAHMQRPPAAAADEPTPPAEMMQLNNMYIVAADEDGLLIVDQHALHERLIYNDLKTRLAEGGLEGQRMLLPATISVTPADADLLGRHSQMLARLGIEVTQFGPDSVAVQQFPTLLANKGAPPEEFMRELLDRLGEDESTDPERLLEDVLEMTACKAAVKAGDPLSETEMRSLLSRLGEAEKGISCPHGRPTSIKLSMRDLQRQFKR